MRSKVKIRKETNYWLVYFVEIRRLIGVNELGAKILDYFFNKNYSVDKIQARFSASKTKNLSKEEILKFLYSIKKELRVNREGYPIIDQEQMNVPIAIELQINTTCNLRCKHCFQKEYGKLIHINKIKRILKILDKEKVFEITLVGGEPFLHPKILEIIKLCDKYNFATNIVTNALLLNESLIKKLTKFKNLAFLVSLEGVKEINDRIRGNGVFKKVDKAIKLLKRNKIYLEISSTINAENINYYREMIKYSTLLDVPCNFNLFKPFNKENHPELILKPDDYFSFVEDLFKLRMRYSKLGLTNAAIVAYLTNKNNKKRWRNECRATLSGLTIDVNGNMVPCPSLQAAAYYDKIKLPQFNENFIKTWKDNRYFKEFRKGNLKECQARSYIFNKSVTAKDPYGVSAFLEYKSRQNS